MIRGVSDFLVGQSGRMTGPRRSDQQGRSEVGAAGRRKKLRKGVVLAMGFHIGRVEGLQ